MTFREIYRQREIGLWFLIALCSFFFLGELINGRLWMSDLEVYYRAAGRLLEGKNLYRYAEDAHYIFKYSPVSAAYFIPVLILPFSIAKILYWLFLTWIIVLVFRNVLRCADYDLIDPQNHSRFNNIILTGGIFFAVHYLRELHLGQVNFLLLAFYVWSIVLLENNKPASFGFVLAFTIFLKPFGLIFLPWLILMRKYKEVLWLITGLTILSLIPLLFYQDWQLFIQQYNAWFNEIAIELGNKQNLFQPSNHTLTSVIARYSGIENFMSESSQLMKYYKIAILILIAAITYLYIRKRVPEESVPDPSIYDMAFLTALIPLLSFTSENAFLFVLPAALIVLSKWKVQTLPLRILTFTGLLLIGGNFSEITGKKLSRILEEWSILTPGAVLILIVLFCLKKNFRHQAHEVL